MKLAAVEELVRKFGILKVGHDTNGRQGQWASPHAD